MGFLGLKKKRPNLVEGTLYRSKLVRSLASNHFNPLHNAIIKELICKPKLEPSIVTQLFVKENNL